MKHVYTVIYNCETGFKAGRSSLIEAGPSGLMKPNGPDLLASEANRSGTFGLMKPDRPAS